MKRWLYSSLALLLGFGLGSQFIGSFSHGQGVADPVKVSAPRELTSYRDVVKQVLPAVVSIESKAKTVKIKQQVPSPRFDDPRFPDLRRFFEESVPCEPAPQTGFGSGFFIDST